MADDRLELRVVLDHATGEPVHCFIVKGVDVLGELPVQAVQVYASVGDMAKVTVELFSVHAHVVYERPTFGGE